MSEKEDLLRKLHETAERRAVEKQAEIQSQTRTVAIQQKPHPHTWSAVITFDSATGNSSIESINPSVRIPLPELAYALLNIRDHLVQQRGAELALAEQLEKTDQL